MLFTLRRRTRSAGRRRRCRLALEALECRLAPASFRLDVGAALSVPVPLAPTALVALESTPTGERVVALPTVDARALAPVAFQAGPLTLPTTVRLAPGLAAAGPEQFSARSITPPVVLPLVRSDLFGIVPAAEPEASEDPSFRTAILPDANRAAAAPAAHADAVWKEATPVSVIHDLRPAPLEQHYPEARTPAAPICAAPPAETAPPAAATDTTGAMPLLVGLLGVAALIALRSGAVRRQPLLLPPALGQ